MSTKLDKKQQIKDLKDQLKSAIVIRKEARKVVKQATKKESKIRGLITKLKSSGNK